jgi:hypothetical protein
MQISYHQSGLSGTVDRCFDEELEEALRSFRSVIRTLKGLQVAQEDF